MEQFIYDFFLGKLGSRIATEVHLTALYTSVRQLRNDSKKIDMFGRILGLFDEVPEVHHLLHELLVVGKYRRCWYIGMCWG